MNSSLVRLRTKDPVKTSDLRVEGANQLVASCSAATDTGTDCTCTAAAEMAEVEGEVHTAAVAVAVGVEEVEEAQIEHTGSH